jgi:hypothetical protein
MKNPAKAMQSGRRSRPGKTPQSAMPKVDQQRMANSLAKTAQPFRAKEQRIGEGVFSDQDRASFGYI